MLLREKARSDRSQETQREEKSVHRHPAIEPAEQRALPRRIPGATYRLQFCRDLTFRDAAGWLDYLRDLGITDCYASPIFQAGPQSTHGYDICRFDRLNPNLGTDADFAQFAESLRARGMGLLLDMVPNHMGNDLSNCWWLDVLDHGVKSKFASYFDIDWNPPQPSLRNKVLLPVLEDHYARVIEAGKLRLDLVNGRFVILYYDKGFPVAPHSCATLLEHLGTLLHRPERGVDASLKNLAMGYSECAASDANTTASRAELYGQLAALVQEHAAVREALEALLRHYNGSSGKPQSFGHLDALLGEQNYRLACWRLAASQINYRRFFDIAELVSIRMELPEVFEATHGFVLQLIAEGKVTGLRIDHPDGLWDPTAYFQRLQALGRTFHPKAETSTQPLRLYILAEKITCGNEPLPEDWPIDGTTGYDFLNQVNGLFVDGNNADAMDALYHEVSGHATGFEAEMRSCKMRLLDASFPGELDALSHQATQLAHTTRAGHDLTWRDMRSALSEVVSAFPVYRTYIAEATRDVSPHDRRSIEQAVREAKEGLSASESIALDLLGDLLLLAPFREFKPEDERQRRRFVLRFQQLTGPVMAKGVEDTAFYRYHRLISLNEVGGDPAGFGNGVEEFHRQNERRLATWPHALLATATHDTKRGEDLRARLNVLSEMPSEWGAAVRSWRELNPKQTVDGHPAPDPNDEYLLYQTLIGAWPMISPNDAQRLRTHSGGDGKLSLDEGVMATFCNRVCAYMLKAIKEAKVHTSWTDPHPAYEEAVVSFVRRLFSPAGAVFLETFTAFQRKVAYFGIFNSLAQVLLKITAPGVPDFYQGTELWDLNLVDPDNRRRTDFALRQRLLNELRERWNSGREAPATIIGEWIDSVGRIKMWIIHRALALRNRRRELFDCGAYVALRAAGAKLEHVVAFARTWSGGVVITVVPRLVVGLLGGAGVLPVGREVWGDTWIELPAGAPVNYRNALTGERVCAHGSGTSTKRFGLGEILTSCPVALLESEHERET